MWSQAYFDFIKEKNVKALSYINCDWDALWMYYGQSLDDARVQDNDFVLEHWLQELSDEMYLHSSDELYTDLGYHNAPEPATIFLTGCGLLMFYRRFKKNKLKKH